MITYIYLAQTIIGIFLWKRLKFSWNDSIIYSLMILPNILLVSIIAVELFMSKLSFVREKLYGRKHGLEKLEENSIKCTGNNDNGCFMHYLLSFSLKIVIIKYICFCINNILYF